MKGTSVTLLSVALLIVFGSGCGTFLGGLRRDFDDGPPHIPPTVGGSFQEAEYLGDPGVMDDRGRYWYSAVGHTERGPASTWQSPTPGDGSWEL